MKLIPKYQNPSGPINWHKLYPGIKYNTDLNSIKNDPLFSTNALGEVIYPSFEKWANGNKWNDIAPSWMSQGYDRPMTYGELYDNMASTYGLYNTALRIADRKNHPERYRQDSWFLNQARRDLNLTPLGESGEYVNGIATSIRDFIPYSFNRGVEYVIGKPINFVLNAFANSPVSTNGAGMYSYSPGMLYFSNSGSSNLAVEDFSNNVLSWTTPSGIAGHIFPDFIENVRGSEWGNAVLNALDLYLTPKMYRGKTYRGIANGVDYVRGRMGNSAAATRYIGRNMLYDPMEGTMPGITIKPTVRTRVGDVEVDNPALSYRQGGIDMIDDYNMTGKVTTPGVYENPIFSQGGLWYGLPKNRQGLLVTGEPLAKGSGSGLVISSKSNGTFDIRQDFSNYGRRRVPMSEEQLNPSNTDAYIYDPEYGYRKVQNTPSTYDITVRKNIAGGDDVIEIPEEETTPVNLNKPDYSLGKAKDLFNRMINMAASDYLTKGIPASSYLYGVGNDWARRFHENLPKETIEEFNAFTKPRMKKYRTDENFDTEFDKSLEGGYVEGNKAAFRDINKGKKADIAAFYNSADDAVVVPERGTLDWANDIGHEVRHRVDSKIPLTEEESTVLYDAYDEDFNLIGLNLFEEGETYDMKPEAVTTNRDARKVVLGNNYHLSLEELNARIEALPDKSVFEAVRKANGYGRRYIEKLEREGKLTSKKAQQFRNAMMKVGAFALPITIGNILMQNIDNKERRLK